MQCHLKYASYKSYNAPNSDDLSAGLAWTLQNMYFYRQKKSIQEWLQPKDTNSYKKCKYYVMAWHSFCIHSETMEHEDSHRYCVKLVDLKHSPMI